MDRKLFLLLTLILIILVPVKAQESIKPSIMAGRVDESIKIDGYLSESAWLKADSVISMTTVEPEEGKVPAYRTTTRIICDQKFIYVGIVCYDDDPSSITAFSKARDAELEDEDNVKIIFDTYSDGRNGYIFSVNPFASRYDAIVSNFGEGENKNWDGIWEAKSRVNRDNWTVEIKIPVSTLTFKKDIKNWGFNVERRIQRTMEVSRWTALSRDYKIGQTIHAGLLSNLPDFNMGIGLIPTVSTIGKVTGEAGQSTVYDWKNSLDVLKKITPDITAQLTINTDFAETEVDSRQTNLTRFPLLYPEKRQFFLEGSDIYDFGLGLNRDFMPFFSRRIGLNSGEEVPVIWGAKLNGKIRNTHFGALATETEAVDSSGLRPTMGVVRIKQNIFRESSFGMISTVGDPYGRNGSWVAGADFTYQTSRFRGDKNFLVGIWALYNEREDLVGEKSAFGIRVDYPNDLVDASFTFRRIGDSFDPSLGFVPRKGINYFNLSADYFPRPVNSFIRKFIFESRLSLYTDLDMKWESYDVFTAPLHFLMESGDRFEFNFRPTGDYLKEPFEISDGVVIDPGAYNWIRYRLELETASKRALSGQATWWFGGFYNGWLDQISLEITWRPISIINFELSFERNIGSLPSGDFVQDLFATRVLVNMSSNLNLSTYIQYDNESNSVGSYSRFRWTFTPRGDLFLVYKHNIRQDITDRWAYESNQFIIKLTYGISL